MSISYIEDMRNPKWHRDEIILALNSTFLDRTVPEISEEDILRNMTLSGNILFDILNPV